VILLFSRAFDFTLDEPQNDRLSAVIVCVTATFVIAAGNPASRTTVAAFFVPPARTNRSKPMLQCENVEVQGTNFPQSPNF
jgi:hypothetical protein